MTLGELYRAAKTALEPVTEDPTFEAACLLEHFCGANRTALLLHGDKPAESEAEQAVLSALEKRKTGEPLQYLLGEWDFMSLTLSCGEGVLIPREDTAVLVEAVCKRLSKTENLPKGLDLCAGTGAVGLSIAKEAHAEVTEVELYDGAFNYLNENLARYPELPVTAVKGDMLDKAFAETLPGSISSRRTRRILRQASCRFCSAKCRKSRKRRWTAARTASSSTARSAIFGRKNCTRTACLPWKSVRRRGRR